MNSKYLHSLNLAQLLMGKDADECTTGSNWMKYQVISSILSTKLSEKDMVTILENCDGERRLREEWEAKQ